MPGRKKKAETSTAEPMQPLVGPDLRAWLASLTPTLPDSPLEEAAVEVCPICLGAGFVAVRLPAVPTTYDECRCGLASQRRIERMFKRAEIPERFRDVSFTSYPGERTLAVKQVETYANGAEMPRESLVIFGRFGRGKTCAATAAMRTIVEREQCSAMFITTPKLLDRIRETYSGKAEDSEAEVLLAIETVQLLVLDDLGAERVTDWVREKLFTVLNARHDAQLPTIYTSNLGPSELAEHIGQRTAERLKEDCQWVEMTGPNLRERVPA